MTDDKTKLLTHLGIAAFSTAIACISQGKEGVIMPVLGGIAGNIASSFFENAEYSKLKTFLSETDPDDLNHDLRKLIVKAIQWAFNNIEIRYRTQLMIESQKKELKDFIKKTQNELRQLDSVLDAYDKTILASIEKEDSPDKIMEIFNLHVDAFPVIDANYPFLAFFKEEFLPNVQLCFGELLKKKEYRPAYIAYTRQIVANMQEGIDQLRMQNETILNKLDNSVESRNAAGRSLEFWRTVGDRIKNLPPDELYSLIGESFDQQLIRLNGKIDLLLEDTGVIRVRVESIESTVGKMEREVAGTKRKTDSFHHKLNENWIAKHKALFIGSVLFLVVMLISGYYYIYTRPFAAVFSLQSYNATSINKEYPLPAFPVTITFFLPGETRRTEITAGNELVLNSLPYTYKNKIIRLKLDDPYWEEAVDSIRLSDTHISIPIKPTTALGRISGDIKSRNGLVSIAGAAVKIGVDTIIYSDKNGFFNASLPDRMKRKEYMLTVEKEGYNAETQMYYPKSGDGQIRLTEH